MSRNVSCPDDQRTLRALLDVSLRYQRAVVLGSVVTECVDGGGLGNGQGTAYYLVVYQTNAVTDIPILCKRAGPRRGDPQHGICTVGSLPKPPMISGASSDRQPLAVAS